MTLLIALALLGATPAQDPGDACKRDTVLGIAKDAVAAEPYLLTTVQGRHLRLLGQDFIDPRTWRAGESLSVCKDPDEPSSRVTFVRITNLKKQEVLVGAETNPAP